MLALTVGAGNFAPLIGIDMNLVFQWINTLVMFLVLRHFLYKPIVETMEKRKLKIKNNLEDADRSNKEAKELKAEYERKIAGIKEEGQEIIREATRNANTKRDVIIKEAQEEAKAILARAEVESQRRMEKAMDEYKQEVVGMTLMTAQRFIDVKLDEEGHEKLIHQFIEEMGDASWQN